MSSLNSIMNIATSGLQTAQEQLKVVSDNITNVNTPGYIRKVANQQTLVSGTQTTGVSAGAVTIAADKYLEQAQFSASSASSQADASYNILDQIQSQFGDLTDSNGLFNQAASTLSAVSQAAESPTSAANRQEVLADMSSFLNEGSRIAGQIQSARQSADSQIGSDVTQVNDLLTDIAKLNTQISSGSVTGQDITGVQTQQTTDIQNLSKLIDVSTSTNANGGTVVRTKTGTTLVQDASAVSLSYQPTNNVTAATSFSPIYVTGFGGDKRDFSDSLSSGEIKGLMDVRDTSSVAVNDQLNQYMAQFANQVNAAHNASSSVPAPTSLTGKTLANTMSEAVSGFSSADGSSPTETNLVTLDTSGNITHKLTLDFSGAGDGSGTWTADTGATGTFSGSSFDTDITSAFSSIGSSATVSYTNGQLTLASNTTEGVAVVDPASTATPPPATKTGQGFSQFFGLNDLISSSVPTTNQTGLSAGANAGFTTGGNVGFTLKSSTGSSLANVNFTMPTSGTMSDLVSALNDTNTGVGRYGTFSLDPSGALTFQGFGNPANTLGISSDTTSRLSASGPSFSQFFSLGGTGSTVAQNLSVNSAISTNSSRLSLAQVNLSPATGTPALVSGDGSGGNLLAAVGNKTITFAKAGLNNGGASTLSNYGADLAGQVGNLSAQAKTARDSSDALLTEATSRRSASEGVNLDEELVNLTTYQQAYSASGRLVQAASDMFTTLLNMMGT